MKTDTLKLLIEEDDIHNFTRKLWRSDVFKDSHDSGGIVSRVIDNFAKYPRFFYEPSDVNTEAPHFSPWWSGIQLREYDNPVIQDLYYLHEIEHACTMPYMAGLNRVTFKNKIRDNEHEASALSEMTIYLHHPELRAQTFPHSIYVDRFLFPDGDFSKPDTSWMERWEIEPDIVRKELMYARASVVTDKNITLDDDPVLFWLNKFADQGRKWVDIWSDRYDVVEQSMIKFKDECRTLGRATALQNHIDFLLSDDISNGTDIPFYTEAAAFAEVYAENKRLYRETMEREQQAPISYNTNQNLENG
jgi:hypothetical protein